ncbi:MAG TPA: alpha/beta hydrolase [Chryseosolibacter sp.]|nr:alpha/beta hydrolase [Chryseosolibacter sp.]
MFFNNYITTFVLVLALLKAYDATALQAPDYELQKHIVTTRDGAKLETTFFKVKSRYAPVVLLIHQCDVDKSLGRTGFENIADTLAKTGINVMFYLQRGYSAAIDNEAETTRTNSGDRVKDAEDVWNYLKSLNHVDSTRVALGGASCGGRVCIGLASEKPNLAKGIMLLSTGMSEPLYRQLPLLDLPLLCITAHDDGLAYNSTLRAFDSTKNAESKLLIVKGELHGAVLMDSHPAVLGQIIHFFQQTLR